MPIKLVKFIGVEFCDKRLATRFRVSLVLGQIKGGLRIGLRTKKAETQDRIVSDVCGFNIVWGK